MLVIKFVVGSTGQLKDVYFIKHPSENLIMIDSAAALLSACGQVDPVLQ